MKVVCPRCNRPNMYPVINFDILKCWWCSFTLSLLEYIKETYKK